ncbi:hypothetical protein AGDE_04398 [Angomonas deanei]|uniref:Hydroxyacylglutathione hydrolase C-terminus, putative n=1 Tax=Angomonas deanei TaxID=59799 RepID=A0A7G2CMG7_9TRYP|nr:hypothetical protein AGDE_04398 [Angomonas deanei]CAD2220615.1 Hydroxyacylglutathione hydrolase C-terminus, putative [Angomonas deanei]|eukprot:EPY39530.1 hypothetical protein AGDE_04398 [Angomonas deanei]
MCAAMKKIYTLHTNFPNGEESDSKTFIFPGHEYTMGFMKFSAKILSDLITCSGVEHKEELKAELDLVQRNTKRYQDNINQGNPSVPSSLKEEKVQNLFLRCSDANFLKNMSQLHKNINNEIQLMDYLYNACD